MIVRAKMMVAFGVMALVTAVISLPVASLAATSPAVSVLSPIVKGLRAPVKIALDAAGNIYVADQRVGGVVKLDATGMQQSVIRTATPSGLAFALDGTLLVSQPGFVARYNVATGQEVGRLTGGQLQSPAGIAVEGVNGNIYVADSRANQVEMYSAYGDYVKSFGQGVSADASGATVLNPPGKLSMPTGISFEKVSRQLAVADSLGNRIQFFDVDGNYVKSIGNPISTATGAVAGMMQFMSPVATVFEYSKDSTPVLNRIYVVDTFQGNVQVVDPSTGYALYVKDSAKNYIGSVGTANGQLMVPTDAVFDSVNNRLLVVNGFGNITIYSIDGGQNPVYVEPPPPIVVPPPVVINPPALSIVTTSFITKSPMVTISGTVEVGALVDVANKASEVVVNGTSWSCDVNLLEGANSLTVTATKLGVSSSAVVIVTLDTVKPVLTVSALSSGSSTSEAVINITGSAADLNGVTVAVNGKAAVLDNNKFSVAVELLNGANTVLVEAVDAVGNVSSDNRTINLDTTAPVIVITAPVDNTYTANPELKMSGTVDDASVAVKVAGVSAILEGNIWTASVALQAGVNTVEIVATDLVGNTSSVKRSVTLDSVNPALAISVPAQDIAVNVPNVSISGPLADSSSLSLEYVANGVTVTVPVVDNQYSFNVDFAEEGVYPVQLTAKDAAGNSSTVIRTVIYDKTPPVFALNQVNGVMPEMLSGTVELGSSIVIKDGADQIGKVAIANDGSWAADLTGISYTPESLLAIATDAAGNSTSKTLVYNFPDGSINNDNKPTVQDALRAIRLVVNRSTPSAMELAHYDIGPLVGGKPNPNGKIEIVDAILILRKALGLKSW